MTYYAGELNDSFKELEETIKEWVENSWYIPENRRDPVQRVKESFLKMRKSF